MLWRHKDVWRTLGGGIDFVTGMPLRRRVGPVKRGAQGNGMVRLCAAPLIHGNAQWAAIWALFNGDTVVLLPSSTRTRSGGGAAAQGERARASSATRWPGRWSRLLAEGGYDTSSLVAVSSSAALFSPTVRDACVAALPNVVFTDAIGASETGFTGLSFVAARRHDGAAVRRAPRAAHDRDRRRRQPGRCRARSAGWPEAATSRSATTRTRSRPPRCSPRWTGSGSSCLAISRGLEDDGTITLLGRGNTCVNTGGEKVFPEEVEGAIKEHPGVFDALVIGIPDERLGQRVAAIVQPREGAVD